MPRIEQYLSENTLKTEIELRLRQAGITVADDRALTPRLYLNVNAIITSDDNYIVYAISIDFDRFLRLPDQPPGSPQLTSATVWSKGSVGITPKRDARLIKDYVQELVSEFLNDYLAENPGRR
jgi:hypothetical protein